MVPEPATPIIELSTDNELYCIDQSLFTIEEETGEADVSHDLVRDEAYDFE